MSYSFDYLRSKYKTFTYENFNFEHSKGIITVTYHFHIDNEIHFHPSFSFSSKNIEHKIASKEFEITLFHIGLIETISYWKTTCCKNLHVKPYRLTEFQTSWLQKLFYLGLGEFRYLNNIEITEEEFISFSYSSNPLPIINFKTSNKNIIPLGGGKDSLVTLDLKNNATNKIFLLNPREASLEICRANRLEDNTFIINRVLDKTMLELNSKGFLNGHTPFSALLSFYTVLVAYLLECNSVILSNEDSANEPTIIGTDINHQYSKSLDYENDFRDYIEYFFSNSVNYYSLLRPLNELQIAKLFSQNTTNFEHFKSCNVGSKTNIWCNNCPKCLFTFIILSPFISIETLVKIFGDNLLNKIELKHYFNELTGNSDIKPFECVGTIDDVNLALTLLVKKDSKNTDFILLKDYKTPPNLILDIKSMNPKNNLNSEDYLLLKNALEFENT